MFTRRFCRGAHCHEWCKCNASINSSLGMLRPSLVEEIMLEADILWTDRGQVVTFLLWAYCHWHTQAKRLNACTAAALIRGANVKAYGS